jgi:hypothetical protein
VTTAPGNGIAAEIAGRPDQKWAKTIEYSHPIQPKPLIRREEIDKLV